MISARQLRHDLPFETRDLWSAKIVSNAASISLMTKALPRVRSVSERRAIVRWLSYSSGRRCEVASSSTQSSSV